MKRDVGRNKVRDQRRQTNTKVHVLSGFKEPCRTQSHQLWRKSTATLTPYFIYFHITSHTAHHLEDSFFAQWGFTANQAIDENPRSRYSFWVQLSGHNNFINLSDRNISRGRKRRMKIACRTTVDKVTVGIGTMGADEGEVGAKSG